MTYNDVLTLLAAEGDAAEFDRLLHHLVATTGLDPCEAYNLAMRLPG